MLGGPGNANYLGRGTRDYAGKTVSKKFERTRCLHRHRRDLLSGQQIKRDAKDREQVREKKRIRHRPCR